MHSDEIDNEEPEQAEFMAAGMAEVAVTLLAVYVAQKLLTNAVLAVKIAAQGCVSGFTHARTAGSSSVKAKGANERIMAVVKLFERTDMQTEYCND